MKDLARATRVKPGSKVDLGDHPPAAKLGLGDEESARAETGKRPERMSRARDDADGRAPALVLVVLQGMDAAARTARSARPRQASTR